MASERRKPAKAAKPASVPDDAFDAHLRDLADRNALPRALAVVSDAYLNPAPVPDDAKETAQRIRSFEEAAKGLSLRRLERAEELLREVARPEDADDVRKFQDLTHFVRRHRLGFAGYMDYLNGLPEPKEAT